MTIAGYLKVMKKSSFEMKETTLVECRYFEGEQSRKISVEQDMLELSSSKSQIDE